MCAFWHTEIRQKSRSSLPKITVVNSVLGILDAFESVKKHDFPIVPDQVLTLNQ
jgi:hypothetical protein